MWTNKNMTNKEYNFIISLMNINIFKDELALKRLKDYQSSLTHFKGLVQDETTTKKIEKITEHCLSFVSQDELDKSKLILDSKAEIELILKKCIGGFSSFSAFDRGRIKIEYNYNYKEESLDSPNFVGCTYINRSEMKSWFLKEKVDA